MGLKEAAADKSEMGYRMEQIITNCNYCKLSITSDQTIIFGVHLFKGLRPYHLSCFEKAQNNFTGTNRPFYKVEYNRLKYGLLYTIILMIGLIGLAIIAILHFITVRDPIAKLIDVISIFVASLGLIYMLLSSYRIIKYIRYFKDIAVE